MAQPPAGSSLLLGALADSAKIKQRKNGSYRMVLEGVDEINWFTDRPERKAGSYKPQKLLKKWDSMFSLAEPNAQAAFMIDGKQKMVSFEMFKPSLNESGGSMRFNLKGIGKINEDKIIGLASKRLADVSLFIDDANLMPACYPNCKGKDLSGANLIDANLSNAILTDANLTFTYLTRAKLNGADLSSADLFGADLSFADLADADLSNANLAGAVMNDAVMNDAILTDAIWEKTTCPDGTLNNGRSPCTPQQLIPA